MQHGLPLYHVERTVEETGEKFGDGSHILYVNGECVDDTALGKLMHDFHCVNPDDMAYPVLREKARERAEAEKSLIKKVLRMLRDGLPVDKIAEYTDMPLEEIKEFAALTV